MNWLKQNWKYLAAFLLILGASLLFSMVFAKCFVTSSEQAAPQIINFNSIDITNQDGKHVKKHMLGFYSGNTRYEIVITEEE